jgi:recombination protein RecT
MVTTDVAKSQLHPLVVLRERLEHRASEIKAALPGIPPERFIRAVITAAQVNPDILACNFNSVWLACMRACRDGLLPDGVEGAIVPHRDKATWIPMYRGMLRKFQQSGQYRWIAADVVRAGEEFEYWINENGPRFKHVPGYNGEAPVEKVYAIATTQAGGVFVAVMSMSEITKIRNMSRATREDAPWNSWTEEMMKKSALRRLSKMLPTSGLDIISDEDFPDADADEAPTEPKRAPRITGAAAALETFASSTPESAAPSPAADREGGGEHDYAPAAEVASSAADASDSTSAATATSLESENIAIAYRRGQEAKTASHKRTAVPGEYRDERRAKEYEAWMAGYDGKPAPRTEPLL